MLTDDCPVSEERVFRDALVAAVSRYEELIHSLSVLREIDDIDDTDIPLGRLCRRVVSLVSSHCRAENCSLMLVSRDGEGLDLWAATSYLDDDVSSAEGEVALARKFRVGNGVAGLVVLHGKPLRLEDVCEAPEFVVQPEPCVSVRSLLCLPLSVGNRTIGVINLSHSQPGFFTEQDEATMGLVADRCARLLSSHRLLHDHRMMERCYQLAFNEAGDGIMVVEEGGRVLMANATAKAIVGFDLSEGNEGVVRWMAQIDEGDRSKVEPARARMWAQGDACHVQYRISDLAGHVRVIEENSTPIAAGADVDGLAICVLRDVTRRVEAENERATLDAQLRHAQKMEALGELAGGITHDFNNILTGILANVSLARADEEAEDLPELLADIEAAAKQGAALTQRLLAISRRSGVERTSVDVGQIVDDVFGILRNTVDRRVALHCDIAPVVWPALAERSAVHQALLNLCVNARDALQDVLGRRDECVILVSAQNATIDEAYCNAHVEATCGEFVCVSVSDTGPGMDETTRTRIFEPFFTTRQGCGGTGLGLAIVYGVARQHLGWVTVDSTPGKGTVFRLYLPRATSPSQPSLEPSGAHHTCGARVLVVDDEDLMRRAAERVLRRLGCKVVCARDGVEAVEVFEEQRNQIDAVLLDLNMPRMNGNDALLRIRQIDPNVAVIISSGHTRAITSPDSVRDPALSYLDKPYTADKVASTLARVLRREPSIQ